MLKRMVRGLLDEGRLEDIAELALTRRRVLGTLIALTYDRDDQIGWRAVEAMGLAAERIAPHDPQPVREHLRRLLWLITEESGGICWRAPEAMAEIAARLPRQFGEFIPIVIHLILEFAEEDLKHFRPAVLWGIGRLSPWAGDYMPEILPAVVAALDVSDSQARGMAVWCLGELGRGDIVAERPELLQDDGLAGMYASRTVVQKKVSQVAQEVLRQTGVA